MFVSLTFVSNNGLGVCKFHLPFTAHEMENFKMWSYHIHNMQFGGYVGPKNEFI